MQEVNSGKNSEPFTWGTVWELQGHKQPHAAADHGSLVHRIHAALRPARSVALLVEKGLWSITGSELRLLLGALGTNY